MTKIYTHIFKREDVFYPAERASIGIQSAISELLDWQEAYSPFLQYVFSVMTDIKAGISQTICLSDEAKKLREEMEEDTRTEQAHRASVYDLYHKGK